MDSIRDQFDGLIHFFECFEVAVVFQGFLHDQIGEGKGLIRSFKSHDHPLVGFLGEDTLKNDECQYKKVIN